MENCTSEWMNRMAKGGSWIFSLCIMKSIEMSHRNWNCAVSLRAKSMVTTKNNQQNYESVKKTAISTVSNVIEISNASNVHSMLVVADKLLSSSLHWTLLLTLHKQLLNVESKSNLYSNSEHIMALVWENFQVETGMNSMRFCFVPTYDLMTDSFMNETN